MKNILLLWCCLLSLQLSSQQREVIDKVVSIIGSELILLSDVEEQRALMEAQNGTVPENVRCAIMDNLLAQKLLLNQSKLDSIVVADEEVQTQLDARIERILSYMNNDVSQFEDYYGQSIGEVKEQFRGDLRDQLLTERMRNEIMQGITVTPSEVKNFFASIPVDSLPYFNSEVEIGEIVAYPKVSEAERTRSIEKLEEIRRQIVEEGADFAELAKKNSDDGSARLGGDLNWTTRGAFVPEFEAAAYNLEEGEISEVVESQFGFHIIQLLGRRGSSIHTRHILIKPEITEADLNKTRRLLDSVRMLVLHDSLKFSPAVKRFSNEKEQSYTNDGRMVNPATGNTFFEIGDLEPDIYFTIDTMKVNGISAPFEFTTPQGETGFRIVQLQSRTSPHKANLKEDYFKIQQAAIESKKSEFVQEWVQGKVDATYIMVDPMYNGCPNIVNWVKGEPKP